MIELLQKFSIQNILIFIVLLALAIKGCISFFDWIIDRNKKMVHKADEPEQLKQNLDKQSKQIDELKRLMTIITNKIDMLIHSDRDSIKAYITKEHHHYIKKGWIDTFTLNCIEKRYSHYQDEGGNSFIANLMDEIRKLPLNPPAPPQQQQK